MRAGKVVVGMLLAAGICAAAVLCVIGAGQARTEFSPSRDTTTVAQYKGVTPTITVTSPNGGERWQVLRTITIRWTWTGNPGPNVKIAGYKGGVWRGMISSSTPNDGSFSFFLACYAQSETEPCSDVKVKITSLSDPSVYDFSDGNFGITSFRMTSPGTGASWKRGTTHSITWTSNCGPGPNVKLALYKGGVWVKMIASSTANDGSYSWWIPASTAAGSDYKVRVTSLSNTADWAASCAFGITQ